MKKRGQIALFIIIGLIILVSMLFLFYATSIASKGDTPEVADTSADASSIEIFVENCLRQVLEDGMIKVGFHNLGSLQNYINYNLKTCTNQFSAFRDIQVTEGQVSSTIVLADNNLTLVVDAHHPLTIRKGSSTTELFDFHLDYQLKSSKPLTAGSLTLYSTNRIAKLTIPPGVAITTKDNTLVSSVSITIRDSKQFPGDTLGFLAYELEPHGARFSPPIELTMEYGEEDLTNIEEQHLKLSYYNGSEWIRWASLTDIKNQNYSLGDVIVLPIDINIKDNLATAKIDHFSPTAISYVPNSIGKTLGLDNKLIAYYPLDGNANDVIGINVWKKGDIHKAVPTQGKFNQAYHFFENSSISIPNRMINPMLDDCYSVSMWINPEGEGRLLHLMDEHDLEKNKSRFILKLTDENKVRYVIKQIHNKSPDEVMRSEETAIHLASNTWHHIAFVKNNESYSMYIDGINQTLLNSSSSEQNTFDIGAQSGIGGLPLIRYKYFPLGRMLNLYIESKQSFKGKIDEVAIWSRPLSDCEIKKLANVPCQDIIITLPEYCEIYSYNVTARKRNSPYVYYSKSSMNNLFTIPASYCDDGYEIIGGYMKDGIFHQTLKRMMDCNLDIIYSETEKDEDDIICSVGGDICSLDGYNQFKKRCVNNVWKGCNYNGNYSEDERCDGYDTNCNWQLAPYEYWHPIGFSQDGFRAKNYSTGSEECDGIDNDCNGVVDEGCTNSPVGIITDDLWTYENGKVCGKYNGPPDPGKACPEESSYYCVDRKTGIMPAAHANYANAAQCFISKYRNAYDTGLIRVMYPSYSFRQPQVAIYTYACDGDPESTSYHYLATAGNVDVTLTLAGYKADTRPDSLIVNGPYGPHTYDYTCDPDCGVYVPKGRCSRKNLRSPYL